MAAGDYVDEVHRKPPVLGAADESSYHRTVQLNFAISTPAARSDVRRSPRATPTVRYRTRSSRNRTIPAAAFRLARDVTTRYKLT